MQYLILSLYAIAIVAGLVYVVRQEILFNDEKKAQKKRFDFEEYDCYD